MRTSPKKSAVSNYELFREFDEDLIDEVYGESQVVGLTPGEVLIKPGIPNRNVYLLLNGLLEVILEKDGSEISVQIRPGECLGEMSLIMDQPTSALARALHTSDVLVIPGEIFWQKMAVTRQGVKNLMGVMAKRLRRTNEALINEVEEQLKYKHLQKELEAAGKIQANMVPDGSALFTERQEIDVYGLMTQARDVGGDFFDTVALDGEHIYFCIGDVSGKGMPASILMARVLTSLRLTVSNTPSFEGIFRTVNTLLAKNNIDMMFVSAFGGVINTRTGIMRFSNAGHNPPFISTNGSEFRLMDMPPGLLLGVLEDCEYEIGEIKLKPGDSIIMYTDGITEAMSTTAQMYGEDRALACLNSQSHPDMNELVHSLERDTNAFVGKAPQFDDMTVLALRYWGE